MPHTAIGPEDILNSALELAQASSWESLRLWEIAHALNISLEEIRVHYRSKDDMVEAYFDHADRAMLQAASNDALMSLSSDERLYHCMMVWFEYLVPYKRLVREMLAYKLELGHVHLQAHGITRVSRTVQWFREAADRQQAGMQRIVDELAVTYAYLTSFACFLYDTSPDHDTTRNQLRRLLHISH